MGFPVAWFVCRFEVVLVHNRVRELRPRLEPFESCVDTFIRADYERCLGSLRGHRSDEAVDLGVRCLLRLGRPLEAIDELDAWDVRELSSCQLADAFTLRAIALALLRDFDRAELVLVDARVHAIGSGSAEREAEAEYTTAVVHLTAGRLAEAAESIARVLDVAASQNVWSESVPMDRLHRLPETRARAYDLAGRLAGFECRYRDQAEFIRLAFAEIDRVDNADHYIVALLLLNLAVLAREIDLPGDAAFVRERVETMSFAPPTKHIEFAIRRALGWANSLDGDHVGALREYRKAAVVAPTVALRVQAVLDRAELAAELNEPAFANDELDHAVALTEQVDWSAAERDEIYSLLLLAKLLAARDVSRARAAFDSYMAFKKNRGVWWTDDLRVTALEQHVRAIVLRAEGERSRATLAFLEAFDAYQKVSHARRAAVVAADLYELTGEAGYLAYAAADAARTPHSHLSRRVAALSGRSAGPVASAVAQ